VPALLVLLLFEAAEKAASRSNAAGRRKGSRPRQKVAAD